MRVYYKEKAERQYEKENMQDKQQHFIVGYRKSRSGQKVLKLLHAVGDDESCCGQKLWRSAIIKAVVFTDNKSCCSRRYNTGCCGQSQVRAVGVFLPSVPSSLRIFLPCLLLLWTNMLSLMQSRVFESTMRAEETATYKQTGLGKPAKKETFQQLSQNNQQLRLREFLFVIFRGFISFIPGSVACPADCRHSSGSSGCTSGKTSTGTQICKELFINFSRETAF